MRPSLLAATLICGLGLVTLARAASVEGADAATGERLAALLRAGRSVISNNQALINDPTIGEKNLSGDRVMREAMLDEAAVVRAVWRGGEPVG